jgi:hypothetical protein
MNIQILTEAPGGYVAVEASEVVKVARLSGAEAVRMRFQNGDYVIVSSDVARGLDRLGIIPPYR